VGPRWRGDEREGRAAGAARDLRQPDRLRGQLRFRATRAQHGHDLPGDALRYRAITSPALSHAAYALIIAAEAATGLAFAVAAGALVCRLRAGAASFDAAKRWAVIGATLAFLLWFLGFMVIGGEWFATWQSATWSGQEAAFRIVMVVLAVLLFLSLPDGELD
jgi:predicted small integral membrane protein